MGRKITVKVLPDGTVQADFSGFGGDDCLGEADRLAEMLVRFGLRTEPTAVAKKPAAQIGAETGEDEERGEWIPAKSE